MSRGGDYSGLVRRLFAAPAHAGSLAPGPGPTRAAEAIALDRGAWLQITARLQAGQVVEARFLAWGCPHFLAACELVTAGLEGRPLARAATVDPRALARQLEAPPEKLGRLLVIEDALRELAAAAAAPQ